MRALGKTLVVCFGCASLALAAGANVTDDSPYAVIPKRNVFGLRPPPPPPKVEEPDPVKAASNIQLTGIVNLDGVKKVLLEITEPGKQGREAKTIVEGERDGAIEILEVNEIESKVKIRNAGQLAVLSFETNGKKVAAAPVPQPLGVPPIPGAKPTIMPNGVPAPATQVPGVVPANTTQPTEAPARSIPSRTMRINPSAQSSNSLNLNAPSSYVAPAAEANLTVEQSTVVMAIQKEANKSAIANGDFPPLPPIPGVDENTAKK